jgi:hypothetical protein
MQRNRTAAENFTAITRIVRVGRLSRRIRTQYQATKLWNWIDHQPDCDALWRCMMRNARWAFDDDCDGDANWFTFVYLRGVNRV